MPKRKLLILFLIGALVVGIFSIASGTTVATELEKNDAFCASCHTEPETTYVMRSTLALDASSLDLASYHYANAESIIIPAVPNMRCVDCHRGEGIVGRSIVLSLAAYDTIKHFTGTAKQPAIIVYNIQNEACLKCHDAEVRKFVDQPEKPFILDNHYHYKYFRPGAPPMQCVSCHPAHVEASHINKLQLRRITIPVCEDCHRFEGKGPVKMQ